ncbi:ADP-ribosylation [Laetiporus sulphureus 93-53]|uniref:ADP-ribosylation n=1 Tax=Laetiporus sulphureus 93-53 TaxID=1314785 RepID=A0A165BGY0_9APHY|nr:ADP-ribosylation [Laetiporus sulphureus 93-53]KZT01033.1 ADP-ribosylation [Laetiporus sulphureus 93-53]
MCPDRSRNQNTPCKYPGCENTVWKDPDGSYSSYCGLTHRDAMAQITNKDIPNCKSCNVRPVYVENGRKHDFCGLRCARSYGNGGRRRSNSLTRVPAVLPTNNGRCQIPGCVKPAFKNPDQTFSQYCSNGHRSMAVTKCFAEACLLCDKYPKSVLNGKLSDFCSRKCGQDAVADAPRILHVPSAHKIYNEVEKQFLDGWKHPTSTKPTIMKIYRIYSDKDHNEHFCRYRLSVERKRGLDDGNSKRRWHGTVRTCQLGDNENLNLRMCNDDECSLCCIIRSSFRLAKFGAKTNFGRFGEGIYTSATSSKANDYNDELGGSPYRTMLLNDVVIGKTIKLMQDNEDLKAPPGDHDSVTGEPGGSLNYDECIVYKNEAIRPLFLLIYRMN